MVFHWLFAVFQGFSWLFPVFWVRFEAQSQRMEALAYRM